MNQKWQRIEFPIFNDERGSLTPFEFDDTFPFPVKRTYLVTAHSPEIVRGAHAHLVEEELFIASSGRLTATIHDGKNTHEIVLDKPNQGLLIRKHCWHEFSNFSPDAVMLCFSSTHYLPGEGNYLTDKEEFLQKFGD